jgi:hypothetical protein
VYDQVAVCGNKTVCDDVVGNPHGDNPFELIRWSVETEVVNGDVVNPQTGTLQKTYNNVPLSGPLVLPTHPPNGFMPPRNASFIAQAMTEAMARTNPQNSSVNLPAFLAELRDFPELASSVKELFTPSEKFLTRSVEGFRALPHIVRWRGSNFAKKIASGNLAWRFGIAPMIGDVAKLLKFTDAVNQRMKWLDRLATGSKSIRKSVSLGGDKVTVSKRDQVIHSSTGFTFRGKVVTSYSYKDWASLRWKPSEWTRIPSTESGLRFLAARQALGINSYGALLAAWELTPWSWLNDWFSSYGDFLKANNRSLGLRPTRMCLMRMEDNLQTVRIGALPLGTSSKGQIKRQWTAKRRLVVGTPIALPYSTLPVLSTGQWSILGSLALLRSNRSHMR